MLKEIEKLRTEFAKLQETHTSQEEIGAGSGQERSRDREISGVFRVRE